MTDQPSSQPGSGRDVFVSYASPDAAVANTIVDALEKAGLQCWIAPRDVVPGQFYAGEIVHAIDAAKAMVLVLSGCAANSQHVLREVERASSKKHPVVSLRIDLTPLPADLEYFINTSQWLDASSTGVDRALPKLIDAVQRAVGPSSGVGLTLGGVSAGTVVPPNVRPSAATKPPLRPGLAVIALVAVIAVALAYIVVDKFWQAKHRPVAITGPAITTAAIEKSIAVLPFADMSEKKDQEYFSDGLSEDLITALSHIPGLKVIGRTSSFKFRSSSDDSRAIGAKLGVAHLLEGSVRHAGDMVRVSAELINASDGSTQWSERYDRPYKDLFGLQDDLTRAVGDALKAQLMSRDDLLVLQTDRPPSGDLEAYKTVLEGKYYLARDTDADTRRAIERFTRATQLDPRYALAWSLLSRAWTNRGAMHVDLAAAPEIYARARAAANTALSLAPDLTSAHIARGWLLEMADLDWRGAETEYRRVSELVPASGEAAQGLARILASFGHVDRAIELTRQALATDPLNSEWYAWLADFFTLNRPEEAEGAIRKAIELQPGGVRLHFLLTDIEIRRGNAEAALAAAREEPLGSVFRNSALAKALQSGNDHAAANTALKNLLDKGASWDPYDVAQIYAMRNDPDKTFEWLDQAWSYHDPSLHGLLRDPYIGRYRNDSRFIAFCRKVGLPVSRDEEQKVKK